jgi:hypothetical protein
MIMIMIIIIVVLITMIIIVTRFQSALLNETSKPPVVLGITIMMIIITIMIPVIKCYPQ